MKKLIFVLLICCSITVAANDLKNYVSFAVSENSTEQIVFEIDGYPELGPVRPGAQMVLSDTMYEKLKGHYVQPVAHTVKGETYFTCPSIVIERTVEFNAHFINGDFGCGYEKHDDQES